MYEIIASRRVIRRIQKLPVQVQRRLANLIEDLRDRGPNRGDWPNYSKLAFDLYHCHLAPGWVVCWSCDRDAATIEVTYAGSREDAPY